MLTGNSLYSTKENIACIGSIEYEAHMLFEHSRVNGVVRRIAGWFGFTTKLPMLANRLEGKTIRGQREIPLKNVELKQIVGSESRTVGFDARFNPTSERMNGRWIGIAKMWLEGRPLPPIDLVQVGDEYFVRDGHHRVSVARATGAAFIEARVLQMDVD